jgi:multidrug efflux pump subunit AcrB
VFVPMFLLGGVARYPVPAAGRGGGVRACSASYLLSRTLVPTLANYWLRRHDPDASARPGALSCAIRFRRASSGASSSLRRNPYRALSSALRAAHASPCRSSAAMAATCGLGLPLGRYLPGLGQNFFPSVDGSDPACTCGRSTGLRIEETAALCDQVEDTIRRIIPAKELVTIVDNIGLPNSGINMAYSTSAPIGPNDGYLLISLGRDHRPTADYVARCAPKLPQLYPSTLFTFLPADIVSQILNFGLPAPIDVQVVGNNQKANYAYATDLLKRIRTVPGIADLRIQQVFNYPQINVDVDRTLAGEVG